MPFFHLLAKIILWLVIVLLVLLILLIIAMEISPWPSALMIRLLFSDNAEKLASKMLPFAPTTVTSTLDIQYGTGDSYTLLDIFQPSTIHAQGVVIWTHGGAWISGDKRLDRTYFQLLASFGFTVVGLNYGYGPEVQYLTTLGQITMAHTYLMANAQQYNMDMSRVVLAGDSAGAQITSQLAIMITSPAYAQQVGIVPVLTPAQLKGIVLHCGVYEMDTLLHAKGVFGWGARASLWAYTGRRDIDSNPILQQMSTLWSVTADFPATMITGGNQDPLTTLQSVPMADKLRSLGVNVTTVFWPADYVPRLPHEYQFQLDVEAGQITLQKTVDFLQARFMATV